MAGCSGTGIDLGAAEHVTAVPVWIFIKDHLSGEAAPGEVKTPHWLPKRIVDIR
jgi:hypothetical protein